MKKIIILLITLIALLTGCGEAAVTLENEERAIVTPSEVPVEEEVAEESTGEEVEIGEKMFMTQINDIFYNLEDYLGQTIKYEGIFDMYEYPDGTPDGLQKYYSVIRYGPGCCGNDSKVGFEVVWDKEYPEQNDWVEVVGVLTKSEEEGYPRVQLEATKLTVLPTRGEEIITQ